MTERMFINLANADCDRCGKHFDLLWPFKLAESITFRGRVITFPWLCPKCMMREKTKWWKMYRAESRKEVERT